MIREHQSVRSRLWSRSVAAPLSATCGASRAAWSLLARGALLSAVACGGGTLPLQGDTDAGDGQGASAGRSAPPATGGASGGTGATGATSARAGSASVGMGGDSQGEEGGTGGTGAGGLQNGGGVSLEGAPIYTRVQRLTLSQWEHAVTDILSLPASAALSRNFEPPPLVYPGFSNKETMLFVDQRSALDFEEGAEAAAALATESSAALARVYAGDDVEGFVRTLGRRAFRRPLSLEEETRYQGMFAIGEDIYGPGFANGAALVIRAMLQSPHFLYRPELGPGGEPLSSYEIASKLSFLLLDTTPSDDLLDAAEAGELDSVEGIEAVARAMIAEPAAVEVGREFHAQLYNVRALEFLEKYQEAGYSPSSNAEFAQASSVFLAEIFRRGEGLREILTSSRVFVGPTLAELYGMAPVASGLAERTLGPSRMGYFMQVPFLSLYGKTSTPPSIRRGLALANSVLCRAIQPPPDAVEIPELPGVDVNSWTNREVVEAETATCGATCHATFDPLGLSLEHFDGLGRERETDNGKPIDASGIYDSGTEVFRFSDAMGLMRALSESPQAHTCYSKKMSSYGLQRDIVEADLPLLATLSAVSREEGVKEMFIALVTNDAFRLRAVETP